ncbi:hypothetical protein ACFWNH_31160 [Rhodococcus qingshengii]|uniref:hypothetical protein n=1 Tax=Rhodococcus qingshengii TaxID=334542 RepID=UPI00365A1426
MCQGLLHAYSFNNVMLIFSQAPDASQVAGFRTWQQLERTRRRQQLTPTRRNQEQRLRTALTATAKNKKPRRGRAPADHTNPALAREYQHYRTPPTNTPHPPRGIGRDAGL